jgi:hypothetical protein
VLQPLIGDVPFLNGGLFAETELDGSRGVQVPNEAVRLILRELFAQFNFTVTESTPYDVEVAVDPEMLGKVFEELVTGRHETGSYYTPRPIVMFMCREALKHYLRAQVPGLSDEAAYLFVDEHDVSQLSVGQARGVLDALEATTVLDPACGSGAYLLGMLHELVDLQMLLYSSKLIRDSKTLYELKLRVIERNVYGADIDPFAVNIAMLRLWLSLVIEYEGPGDPPALPNLDFKIVIGDSLSAPDPSPALEPDMFRMQAHRDASELASLKAAYMRAIGEEKRLLTDHIWEKQRQLGSMLDVAAPSGAVDWRVEFAEVFDSRGGFDIVLANPPYVRMELFKAQKPVLRKNFPTVHSERADLYCYFYGRAVELLNLTGVMVFISSNKWLRAGYGSNLREYLANSTGILSIIDFGDLPVFQGTSSYPVIFMAEKTQHQVSTIHAVIASLSPPYPDVRALVESWGRTLPPETLKSRNWILASSTDKLMITSMTRNSLTLCEYVHGEIYAGIKTGFNLAFVLDEEERNRIIKSSKNDAKTSSIIKRFIFARDIRRWRVNNGKK